MLKWCAYCQQFMHEIAPYDDFSITHGLCASCETTHRDLFASNEVQHANFLREIFQGLFDAGRHEDFETAATIIAKAIDANCRPVDILIGMISPMLYEIGEEWKRGALSVEGEHRFTAFSERVIRLVESRIDEVRTAPAGRSKATLVYLMNAPGNRHSLGVRILALWLESRGARVRIIDDEPDNSSLMQQVAAERAEYLLISMALTEQRDLVAAICDAVQALPLAVRPKVIVGGYPVKAGLIEPIPAAEFLSDISALSIS
jgi:methanogenic corrinoid protein MtbC1